MQSNLKHVSQTSSTLCAVVEQEGNKGLYRVEGVVDPTNPQGPVIEELASYQERRAVQQMPGGFTDIRKAGKERLLWNIPDGYYPIDVILVAGNKEPALSCERVSRIIHGVQGEQAILQVLQRAGYTTVKSPAKPTER